MKIRNIFSILAICMAMPMFAQEVDKATVQKQADAAQSAAADLQKADTGEKAWKFNGVVGMNAAATGLFNWAAGGNNNVNGVVYGKFRLLYHKNNVAWDTNLDMGYGLSWINQEYDALQKSSDNLTLTTKFGWEFKKAWYLTVLGGFNTQFAKGYSYDGTDAFDPIISKFMAPAYSDISVGIDWKPNDIFSVYLSPVAGRFTSVVVNKKLNGIYSDKVKADYEKNGKDGFNEDPANVNNGGLEQILKDKYAVFHYVEDGDMLVKDYSKNLRAELGLSLKGNINYTYKDLKILTSLGLFTPYAWDKKEVGVGDYGQKLYRDNNRRFGHFDVDWTTSISYQFLKCLQVTLSTDLRYYNGVMIAKDEEENGMTVSKSKERVQFKGIIGLGIGYSF